MTPVVSCIVPVYNGARFVGDAIASILAQTHRALEVVVIDDGSTDATAEALQHFGDEVRVFRVSHGGLARARNLGVAVARGDYIAFLDADDTWGTCKLERQLARFADRPALDLSMTGIQNFWDGDLAGDPAQFEDTRFARPLPGHSCCTLLAPRAVFDRVGPFADLPLVEDVDWFLRARDLGLVSEVMPDVLVRRRLHGQNASLVHRERIPTALVDLAARTIARRRAPAPERPLVSCCITTFNSERFVGDAIASVFRQSYAPLEVLVVDDGSTDRTLEVAAAWGPRVRVVPGTGREIGPPATRNRAIRLARGPLVALLDADDLWEPEKVARQVACLESTPDAAYCLTQARVFWADELGAEAERFKGHQRAAAIPGYGASCLLARRDAFERIGYLDETMFFGDALEWFTRADRAGLVRVMVPDVLMLRRFHSENLTRRRRDEGNDRLVDFVKAELDRRRAGARNA